MSYRNKFSLKGLMIAIALAALVLSGLFAKFVSLGSAPLVLLMALIVLDLVDSRRRRTSWRAGGVSRPVMLRREDALTVEMEEIRLPVRNGGSRLRLAGDVAPRGRVDRGKQRGGMAQVGWMFSNRLNCPATIRRLCRQKSGWVMSAPNRAAKGAA